MTSAPNQGDPSPATFASRPIDAQTRVGRYLVLRELVRDATHAPASAETEQRTEPMLAAWDGELGRTVAIRVLAAANAETTARARREAQILARLADPNVLRVHDVGEHDGRVFLVMEYVEGKTLAGVRATARAGMAAWLAAGRGLAAGHRAALIHGDFRPGNVRVGDDGRPRVTDFGRTRGPESVPYTAPEVEGGATPDARADQFSYCVALYEALSGALPFASPEAARRGPPRTSIGLATAPLRVRRAVLRGLSPRSSDRFASMDVLLAELEPRRRSVWWAAGAATAGIVVMAVPGRPEATAPVSWCAEVDARADALWSDERSRRIESAFVASGVSFATGEYRRAVEVITERALALRAAERSACEMAATGELGASHQLCLHMQHEQLAGLADMLERADATVIEHAGDAARSLPMVTECASPQRMIPEAASSDAEVTALAGVVARATSAAEAWRDEAALAGADQAAAKATELGAHWLAAEAHSVAARVLARNKDDSAAMVRFDASFGEALAADHHDAAVVAALGLAGILAERGDHDGAQRWLGHAEAAAKRAPGDRVQIERLIRRARAEVAYHHEDFVAAKALFAEELEDLGDAEGRATSKLNFGLCEANLGHVDAAIQWLEASLASEIEAHGSDHPATLRPLNAICHVQVDRGESEAAIAACNRAIHVARATRPGAQPMLSPLYTNLGSAYFHAGQLGPAETHHLAAFDNAVRSQPDDHRLIATIANNLGVLYDHLERIDDAAHFYELAHQRILQGFGPDHPATAMVATNLAMVRIKQGDLDGAEALIRDSMQRIAARLGADHPDLALSHAELGRIAAKRGNHRAAVTSFTRAFELRSKFGGDDVELADTSYGLAIALSEIGAPAPEIAAKVEVAARLYRAAGGNWAARADDVEAWHAGLRRSR